MFFKKVEVITKKSYKIRKLTSNNKTGDSLGITIPKHIANKFKEICFYPIPSGDSIVLQSGCKTEGYNG